MNSEDEYRPNSLNAQIARLTTLNENEANKSALYRAEIKESLVRMHAKLDLTNGRVNSLERDRWFHRGIAATLGVMSSALWQYVVGHK